MGQLYTLVNAIFEVYIFLIFIRCILSWIPMGRNVITQFIVEMTEPYLAIFRNLLSRYYASPVDFSPMLALLSLYLIRQLVMRLLFALI